MLDTNICSYVLRAHPRTVIERFRDIPVNEIAISALVAAELRFGAVKRGSAALSATIEKFLGGISVRAWPLTAASHYASLRSSLERSGMPIGGMDMLIAAHALAEDATLVTHNTREFERVPGLRVELWS
jgi:tRNA(fMet)-specific endonuclease VapC